MAPIKSKKKRREEIVKNLTQTIQTESAKPHHNVDLVAKLQSRLDSILNGTFVSKMRKAKK
jgi:hypothetical protein|tara:strand:+ start:1233 stop:1415 length:183 start_codon:yes stop_codon:yes gene_type:complete